VAEERGRHELKGVPEPVMLFRLIRASGVGRRAGHLGRGEETEAPINKAPMRFNQSDFCRPVPSMTTVVVISGHLGQVAGDTVYWRKVGDFINPSIGSYH
jgi:hypothetical protein